MESEFSPYITSADKRQFLHLSAIESLMRRRIHLLKLIAIKYEPQYIEELDRIAAFITSLRGYVYTEDAFTSQNLDGVLYRGVTLEQFFGKYLKPNSEVKL
ncbi:hypothetical protein Chro_1172 [Chroococcidiopsis thermalis PCC 7203]|uniref:Uncharacterized protein n=2 Tax=Chroococcidiopsis thermalis TaxID=54299 RepID=K9TXH7_CHRTP|nr:hypothetical protein Chro_1172 [Chroococcidiopsis thermalis PCC 7203]